MAAKHTTRDGIKYGRFVRSFSEHHGQRISHAIVMADASNICAGTTKLKKGLLTHADTHAESRRLGALLSYGARRPARA